MVKPTVFIDANVWFSAARSSAGGSFLTLWLAKENLIKTCANSHVLDEAERNLLLKSAKDLPDFFRLVRDSKPILINSLADRNLPVGLIGLVPPSDIPVIIGALNSKAEYLVSLDKKHLVNPRMQKLNWPFKLVSPGDFLAEFRKLTK